MKAGIKFTRLTFLIVLILLSLIALLLLLFRHGWATLQRPILWGAVESIPFIAIGIWDQLTGYQSADKHGLKFGFYVRFFITFGLVFVTAKSLFEKQPGFSIEETSFFLTYSFAICLSAVTSNIFWKKSKTAQPASQRIGH